MSSSLHVSAPIFREYIGAKSSASHSVPFDKVPIHPNVKEVHFILAFARDLVNNGTFSPKWHTGTYNRDTIIQIKAVKPNVKKVVLSIGGPRESPIPFNPIDKNIWINNATKSLQSIIQDYNLDGIDVNYEKIDATPGVFAECIGTVIKNLKDNLVISVASIAPSKAVDESHYLPLYQQFQDQIDWVNYQFYDENLPTVNEFVSRYITLAREFYTKPNVLLPGLSTNLSEQARLPPQVFIDGCKQLKAKKKLPGVFIWDADESEAGGFAYEQIAQQLLVDP